MICVHCVTSLVAPADIVLSNAGWRTRRLVMSVLQLWIREVTQSINIALKWHDSLQKSIGRKNRIALKDQWTIQVHKYWDCRLIIKHQRLLLGWKTHFDQALLAASKTSCCAVDFNFLSCWYCPNKNESRMFHTKRFGFVVGSGIEPLLRFRFWDAVFLAGSKLKEYQEESNWWIYSTGTIYIITYMHAVYIVYTDKTQTWFLCIEICEDQQLGFQ